MYKKSDKQVKITTTIYLPIHVDNKGLEFIHLNSILHENDIINCLPGSLGEDEIPSTVYSLSDTIRHKISNYKDTVRNI